MCVHSVHCKWDGCKYGKEDSCPVYLGWVEPENVEHESGHIPLKPSEEEFALRVENSFRGLTVV